VYSRNDVIHVCFAGKYFGPTKNKTAIAVDSMVTIEDLGSNKITVTFKKPKQAAVTETWFAKKVPVTPRGE
jgi:hypothetical protein